MNFQQNQTKTKNVNALTDQNVQLRFMAYLFR